MSQSITDALLCLSAMFIVHCCRCKNVNFDICTSGQCVMIFLQCALKRSCLSTNSLNVWCFQDDTASHISFSAKQQQINKNKPKKKHLPRIPWSRNQQDYWKCCLQLTKINVSRIEYGKVTLRLFPMLFGFYFSTGLVS